MLSTSLPLALTVLSQTPGPIPTAAASLSLSVVPLRLPADGKTYPAIVVGLLDASGNPSLSLNSTTVYLTSSQENVGTIAPSVVIPPGNGFVVASFTTTSTAGITELTASATGIKSAQINIETKTPSGFATSIKVTAEPGNVLSRPGGFGSLVVQLQDETGAPAKAAFDTVVSITSSNNAIAQPDESSVTIPTGENIAVVNYTSGYTIGAATITASASGFTAGITSVGIVGSPPFQLRVAAQPNDVVLSSGGRAVIWLEDPSGNPARAPSSVIIAVTSSNLTVASMVQDSVTIPAGQVYATANFTTTATQGTSQITASAQGLLSAFDTVRNSAPVHGPAGLNLYVAPNPVLADNSQYQAVLVSVVNSTGAPEVANVNYQVNITSSNTAVGSVTTHVVIALGKEFATAQFQSTYLVGSTVLTASAQGLLSVEVEESTFGPIPASVQVFKAEASIPADSGTYQALAVVLQDAFGNPAVAASNVVVQLTSSRPNVMEVSSPITIPAGQTYAFASVHTELSAGSSNITATASGYASSSTVLTAVVPAPVRLAAYVGPRTTINSTIAPDAMLTIQLQDVSGFPAQARQTTGIVVTSSNRTLFKQPITMTINPGADYATASLQTSTFGQTNLTASSAGLSSASVVITVLKSPINFTIPLAYSTITGQAVTLSLRVFALNHGYEGANVTWSAKSGTVTPSNSTTDAQGIASTSFVSNSPGVIPVTALVSTPLAKLANLTTNIIVTGPPIVKQPSLYDKVSPYLLYIIIVVVVVVAVVVYWFWWRPRRKKKKAVDEANQPYDELEEMPSEGGEPTTPAEGGLPSGEQPAGGEGEAAGGETPAADAGSTNETT